MTAMVLLALVGAKAEGKMEDFIRRYATDRGSLASFYSIDSSDLGSAQRTRFLKDQEAKLDSVDYDKLSVDEAIDFQLTKNELDYEKYQLDFVAKRHAEVAKWIPFAKSITDLEEGRWTLSPIDPEATAGKLDELKKAIKKSQDQLRAWIDEKDEKKKAQEGLTPVLAQRAARYLGDLSDIYARWFNHYEGFKPLFGWWCKTPYDQSKAALDEYARTMREDVAGIHGKDDDPLIGDPIGREGLERDLKHEMIGYSPEGLVDIANREFKWCEAEMLKASNEMGFGNDWKKALEKVRTLHVAPGEQDDLVMHQAKDAIKFLEDRDLITIEPLCRDTWRVDMNGVEGQRVLPFAAYGGQTMIVSYPLPQMDHETKEMSLRGNNIHFTRIVTPHELIPGHHLQAYMAERYRPYRSIFTTPFLIEGWALYWEMKLWDYGYARGPEDRIGMLFWRMHRCARIIVSLQFHLGKMKPQEMIDFLVERVGHERFTATSEVRRFIGGGYSPLYQCAYMIGGLQLRALFDEFVGSKKMTAKQFNDGVMHENAIPIAMIKASLEKSKPAKGFKPDWKF